jgi:hypothetical protein
MSSESGSDDDLGSEDGLGDNPEDDNTTSDVGSNPNSNGHFSANESNPDFNGCCSDDESHPNFNGFSFDDEEQGDYNMKSPPLPARQTLYESSGMINMISDIVPCLLTILYWLQR